MSRLPEQRFSERATDYDKYRPTYPPDVLRRLGELNIIRKKYVVADIGSGTGRFSALLVKNENKVFGVEPNENMRTLAELALKGEPNFTSINGTSENTTLPDASVDAITSAQAFHWFKTEPTRREFRRILKPNGHIVLLWNTRRNGTPFMDALETFIREYAIDYEKINFLAPQREQLITNFFQAATPKKFHCDHTQILDFNGLLGFILSASYMPGRNHQTYEAMHSALVSVFDKHSKEARVSLEYRTDVYYAR